MSGGVMRYQCIVWPCCRRLTIGAMALVALGCESFVTPEHVTPLEEIIHIAACTTQPLPADGVSTTAVFAQLPLYSDKTLVKFTTTMGHFQVSASKERTVRAGPFGTPPTALVATVSLVAADSAGTATVQATVEGYSDHLQISFDSTLVGRIDCAQMPVH